MITILRLGHRKKRDARISTHCGLVARAFGADNIIYSGEEDERLLESIRKVTKNWGGQFKVSYEKNWRKVLRNKKTTKVHLTMFGLSFESKLKEIQKISKRKPLLVIVGGEKVPGEVYQLADYNLSVTSQPHSEVAALGVFLYALTGAKKKFKKAKLKIIPMAKGKKVVSK